MVRMMLIVAIAAMIGFAAAYAVDAQQNDADKAVAKVNEGPTGRTIADIHREYAYPKSNRLEAPQPEPLRIVEANVIALTDRQGNVRAEMSGLAGAPWSPQKGNGGCFRLFDDQGHARLELREADGVARVHLLDENGDETVVLQAHPDGKASVRFGTPVKGARAPVEIIAGGKREMTRAIFRGPTGETAMEINIDWDAGGNISILHAGKRSRFGASGTGFYTDNGGPSASFGIASRRAGLHLGSGGQSDANLELVCAGQNSWLKLAAGIFSGVHLRASDEVSSLTLRPQSAEGGVTMSTRQTDHGTETKLWLSDQSSLQMMQFKVTELQPTIRLINEQGVPVFKAP